MTRSDVGKGEAASQAPFLLEEGLFVDVDDVAVEGNLVEVETQLDVGMCSVQLDKSRYVIEALRESLAAMQKQKCCVAWGQVVEQGCKLHGGR